MKLKNGVSLEGVQWQMFVAAIKAEEIYKNYGAELVITSGTDGKHGKRSLHPKGLALDLRMWTLQGREFHAAMDLRKALGDDYDVVVEKDHIHMEYDPK